MRVGNRKLVANHVGPWETYDLSRDRVEANDLAKKETEQVKKLCVMYDGYAKRAKVEPWPLAATGK